MKKSETLCSPYVARTVKMGDRLTKIEKHIGFHMMNHANIEEIVFQYEKIILRRREVMSMRQTIFIHNAVINAWSMILDTLENLRSKVSPLRLFFTTVATVMLLYILVTEMLFEGLKS